MQLIFHTIDDSNITINKDLSDGKIININLKSDTDVTNPVIKLMQFEGDNFNTYNYAHIPELNRYYFINNITQINNRVIEISFTCDVLETYKEDILNSNARFKRTLKHGDYIDSPIDFSLETDVKKYETDVQVFTKDSTTILTTIGA